jgi:hypothetical protein
MGRLDIHRLLNVTHPLPRINSLFKEYGSYCLSSSNGMPHTNLLILKEHFKSISLRLILVQYLCSVHHSGHVVLGMNCICLLEHWDCGFESHSRHGYLFVLSSGLVMGWSLVQWVLPTVLAFHECPVLQVGATEIQQEDEDLLFWTQIYLLRWSKASSVKNVKFWVTETTMWCPQKSVTVP